MKIEWQEHDIICGRQVYRPGQKVPFVIGYVMGKEKCIVLVDLRDGLVIKYSDAAELMHALNKYNYVPVEIADHHHYRKPE